MRSVVCCDVINLLALVIHNGQPRRYAVLQRLEMLAWSFASYLSLHLSLPNLPPYLLLFSIQILIQFAHQRKPAHSMKASLWTSARNQHLFLLFPRLCIRRFASYLVGNNILCLFVDCLKVDTPVSALVWPVNTVLTTRRSGPIFPGQLQRRSQLVDTS